MRVIRKGQVKEATGGNHPKVDSRFHTTTAQTRTRGIEGGTHPLVQVTAHIPLGIKDPIPLNGIMPIKVKGDHKDPIPLNGIMPKLALPVHETSALLKLEY